MPTPGQISKENLKQILVFFPAVVYNICVVLFSFQLNYTTQKRICPACGLQILFCLLGAFFHSPFCECGRRDLNPYGLPHAPQTCAYAYSATTANIYIITNECAFVNRFERDFGNKFPLIPFQIFPRARRGQCRTRGNWFFRRAQRLAARRSSMVLK